MRMVPSVGIFQAGDHPHGGGLAAARGAEEHQELAIGDPQVELRHPHEGAPALGYVLEGDYGHDGLPPPYVRSSVPGRRAPAASGSTAGR